MPSPDLLAELFRRRLLIVSGKGGVGKTTVAVALARLAAQRGAHVLLAGIESSGELGRLLGRPELGPESIEISPRLEACDLNPDFAMREFLRRRLKVHAIADRIAKNRAFAGFFTAAPGLREFVLLGKAWEEARVPSGWLSSARHDLVVLDAPATGHAVTFLRAAHQVTDILVGPLKSSAREIRDFLTDPARTALVLVAAPEELALNEAVELARHAKRELAMAVGLVVLNSIFPRRLEGALADAVRALASAEIGRRESTLVAAGQFRVLREAEQARLLRRARRALPRPQIAIDRLLEPEDEEEILAAVAAALSGVSPP